MKRITKNKLTRLYKIKKLTMNKIGFLYTISGASIFYYLKKYKIKTRNISEALLLNSIPMPKCINCGKQLSRRDAKRCKVCDLIFHKGINGRNFKGGKAKCMDCGKLLSCYTVKRCCQCLYKLWNKNPKKHPNFRGGISKDPYSFEFTKELKKEIHKRDNYKCQLCGLTQEEHIRKYKQKLTVHHIDYNKQNENKDNLITLCFKCHSKTNGNRDYYYAYFEYIMKDKCIKNKI